MARKLLLDVKRPPSPYDSTIEYMMSKAGKWSSFDLDRAVTILELYRNTDCPEPDDIPEDVSIRQVELWWEHFEQFQEAIFDAPMTDAPTAAAKLRVLRQEIHRNRRDELAQFDAIVSYLMGEANALSVPPCPYEEATEELLFRFSHWGDEDIAEAAQLAIAYRAWHWSTSEALRTEQCNVDEINDHLSLRLGCLEDAIRIAPATGPVGAAAKIRLMLDQGADDLRRVDTAEVLASILTGLDKAISEASQADLKEAA